MLPWERSSKLLCVCVQNEVPTITPAMVMASGKKTPITVLNLKPTFEVQLAVLSLEAKYSVANIERRLQMGSKLCSVVKSKDGALGLFELYKDEGYILTVHEGRFCVTLKETSSPQDMLKSLYHVNYLFGLERNVGIQLRGAYNDYRPGASCKFH